MELHERAQFDFLVNTAAERFVERLVHFWSNHFAVSVDKLLIVGLNFDYDQVVIRGDVHARSFACAYLRDGETAGTITSVSGSRALAYVKRSALAG